MHYPPYVLLSQNYLKAINTSVNRRRLKNVYVVAMWIPKHDGYDTEDNTDQMLALLEGEVCLQNVTGRKENTVVLESRANAATLSRG